MEGEALKQTCLDLLTLSAIANSHAFVLIKVSTCYNSDNSAHVTLFMLDLYLDPVGE